MRSPRHLASLALLCSVPLFAQTSAYWPRFVELLEQQDVEARQRLLTEWQERAPDDPELYVACFNHYVNAARSEVLVLNRDLPPRTEEAIVLQATDSTQGPAGYLYGGEQFEPGLMAKGFACIDAGIAKFPQRLDMRFGRIHMLGRVGDHEKFTDDVVGAIRYGASIDYRWTWGMDEPVENAEGFMYDAVQGYVHELFSVGDNALLPLMARVAEEMLIHKPDDVPNLTTLGAVHIMTGELDKGIARLERAEKLAPNDEIVIANLAQAYERKEKPKEAIRCYERLIEVGDEDAAAYARSRIQALTEGKR